MEGNTTKPFREQLTLTRFLEELRGRDYDGGYDAVRRYARRWAKERGQSTAAAYVPLNLAPEEAYQFDWSHEIDNRRSRRLRNPGELRRRKRYRPYSALKRVNWTPIQGQNLNADARRWAVTATDDPETSHRL